MNFDISSLDQLKQVIKKVSLDIKPGSVLALHGELGSGKTTFTKLLMKELGVPHPVTSPTFTIINEYPWKENHKIFHLDLYRLKSPSELTALGIEELFKQEGDIIIIEWPELVESLLPDSTMHLYFSYQEDEKRELRII